MVVRLFEDSREINPDDSVCHPMQIAFSFPTDPSLNINVDAGSLNGHGGGGAGRGGAGGAGTGGGQSAGQTNGNGDSNANASDITVTVTGQADLNSPPKVKLCSFGGFGYAGYNLPSEVVRGEGLALLEYDSKSGMAHGAIFAGGVGPASVGGEWTRTWRDWKEHFDHLGFGEEETQNHQQVGPIVALDRDTGAITLGFFAGAGDGSPVGGGFYFTLGTTCH